MNNKNMASNDRIQNESHWISLSAVILIISSLSGIIISVIRSDFSSWIQINILIHTIISSFLFVPISIYSVIHCKRTISIRKFSLIVSGLIMVVLIIALFASGLWLTLKGHQESDQWIPALHTITSYAFLLLLLLHLVLHFLHKKGKRKDSDNSSSYHEKFITLQPTLGKRIAISTIVYGLLLIGLNGIYQIMEDPALQTVEDYSLPYGEHPFRPSQTEVSINGQTLPAKQFIKTEQIAKSQQCGSCHTDIYEQWVSSAHKQAASDPAYVKNITLLDSKRGIEATRYCEGCHAPVALLTGELSTGGKHGGIANTPAHLEGVGCLGCHGINKMVHLNGVASYEFSPKEHYLFDSATTPAAQYIRNVLIRLNPQKHKTAMGSELIEDPQLCASCHEQFMDKSMNDWGWVKMQSEYSHWLASPFSGQNAQNFQNETSLDCQGCHFPLVKGEDPSADKEGMIHSHRSLGANTVLPFLNGDKEQLEATKRFLQSARVLIDIEEPKRKDNIQNHQFLRQELRPNNDDNTPFFFYLGEQATLRITVTNRMVGHSFPAGTTDINQAWIHFTVNDADNHTVYESGFLDDDLVLDKNAHTYHTIPVDREGKAVWRHDLFRMVGDAYKNLIPSGKSDIKEYQFTIPSWAKEPLTATAVVRYRKFNQRYAKWALEHERPELPIVDMARDSLTIPLKVKPIISGSNEKSDSQ